MIPNGDVMAAEFLRGEPTYDRLGWIDAYAMVLAGCKPKLTDCRSHSGGSARIRAPGRLEHWNNPKVAAGCGAVFGPMLEKAAPASS